MPLPIGQSQTNAPMSVAITSNEDLSQICAVLVSAQRFRLSTPALEAASESMDFHFQAALQFSHSVDRTDPTNIRVYIVGSEPERKNHTAKQAITYQYPSELSLTMYDFITQLFGTRTQDPQDKDAFKRWSTKDSYQFQYKTCAFGEHEISHFIHGHRPQSRITTGEIFTREELAQAETWENRSTEEIGGLMQKIDKYIKDRLVIALPQASSSVGKPRV